jgi:hypothetical protein
MYQIINYDKYTKITTLYYDNIGKSKASVSPLIPATH